MAKNKENKTKQKIQQTNPKRITWTSKRATHIQGQKFQTYLIINGHQHSVWEESPVLFTNICKFLKGKNTFASRRLMCLPCIR